MHITSSRNGRIRTFIKAAHKRGKIFNARLRLTLAEHVGREQSDTIFRLSERGSAALPLINHTLLSTVYHHHQTGAALTVGQLDESAFETSLAKHAAAGHATVHRLEFAEHVTGSSLAEKTTVELHVERKSVRSLVLINPYIAQLAGQQTTHPASAHLLHVTATDGSRSASAELSKIINAAYGETIRRQFPNRPVDVGFYASNMESALFSVPDLFV